MSYEAFQTSNAPTWLKSPNGAAWLTALGRSKDQLADLAKQAVRARFPLLAPGDALAAIGSERQLIRADGETDEQYAARLQSAWDVWLFAGSAYGLLLILAATGFDDAVVTQQNGRAYTLDGDGNVVVTLLGTNPEIHGGQPIPPGTLPWWTVDATGLDANLNQFNSRFDVLFPGPFLPVSDDVPVIRTLIATWKAQKATCMGIHVLTDGKCWGWPVRTWGTNGSSWGPSSVTHYSA